MIGNKRRFLRCFGYEGRHPKRVTVVVLTPYVNGFGCKRNYGYRVHFGRNGPERFSVGSVEKEVIK